MSFNNFARKVRDTRLPFGWRVGALRSCVQLYRPIGFHATLSFLAERAGAFDRDEEALVRALEVIEASRASWQAELRVYDEARRVAKRQGARTPGPRNPYQLSHWHGDAQRAALHAVRYGSRRLGPMVVADDGVAEQVRSGVEACLAASGALDPVQRELLAESIRELELRLTPASWSAHRGEYFRSHELLRLARHVAVAAARS